MPPDAVLHSYEERLPDLVQRLEDDRAEWADQARQLAAAVRLRHKSLAVAMRARALLDAVRDTETVVCSEWIVSGVAPDLRSAITALSEHCFAILTDPKVDYRAAEDGLLAAARSLSGCDEQTKGAPVAHPESRSDQWLPIDEAGRLAGLRLNRAGRCDDARRAANWKRQQALPVQKINGTLHARVSDCREWKPRIEVARATFGRNERRNTPQRDDR